MTVSQPPPGVGEEQKSPEGPSEYLSINSLLRKLLEPGLEIRGFSSWHELRVLERIAACRTPMLGLATCPEAYRGKYPLPLFQSCGQRACPNCSYKRHVLWVSSRLEGMRDLEIPFWQVTFKLPRSLERLSFLNPRAFGKAIQRAVSASLLSVAQRDIGARIGFLACYSTLSADLFRHPHLHGIATDGGLNAEGGWSQYPGYTFVSPEAVGRLIPALLLGSLVASNREVPLRGFSSDRPTPDDIRAAVYSVPEDKWFPDIRLAAGGPEPLVSYLAKHFSPFLPGRVYLLEGGNVVFPDRDDPEILHTLSADDFLERALQSVLPFRFRQTQPYGLFAGPRVKSNLSTARNLLRARRASHGVAVGEARSPGTESTDHSPSEDNQSIGVPQMKVRAKRVRTYLRRVLGWIWRMWLRRAGA